MTNDAAHWKQASVKRAIAAVLAAGLSGGAGRYCRRRHY